MVAKSLIVIAVFILIVAPYSVIASENRNFILTSAAPVGGDGVKASNGQILLPANVIVQPGQSTTFQVTLAVPAPVGGVFISLSSSDSSKATITPENIFIRPGMTTAAGAPKVSGISTGYVTITASAFGMGSASQQVQVGGSAIPAAAAPKINSFTATAATVAPGQSVALAWSVTGYTALYVDNNIGAVSTLTSKSVAPARTTTYTLTASGAGGTATAQVTVAVNAVAAAASQILLPANVMVATGQLTPFPVTLSTPAPAGGVFIMLATSDPAKATIWPQNIYIGEGSMAASTPKVSGVSAGLATVTASAYGFTTASQQIQVIPNFMITLPPIVNSFTATPSTIAAGQPVTLSWNVSGATTISIDNGVGDVSHSTSLPLIPSRTTTYVLTASNSGGLTSERVTVTVTAASDTQKPTTPNLLSAVAKGSSEVDLTWTASTDNISVAGYQITRNGIVVASAPASSTVYADTGVSANVTYAYVLKAYDSAGNYSPASNSVTATVPPASAASTVIRSCQAITQAGNYVLGGNLVAANNSCINIHDAQDVHLDCQQYGITADRAVNSGGGSAIVVTNAPRYSISNCTLTALNTTPSASLITLSISNSPRGTITGNTVKGGYILISSSDYTQVSHNTSNVPLDISGNNQTIEYNTITLAPVTRYSAVINLSNSSATLVQNNVLNGGWDGQVRQTLNDPMGADDGLLPYNVTNTIIQNNTILNTWDCGIENMRPMVNVQILNNQITTAGICGIGGWYGNSLKNVTISGNTITDAPRMLDYWRADGLYTQNGEQYVYFEGNTFTNNKLVKPRISFQACGSLRIDLQTLPAGIPSSALSYGSNIIANNDFGPLATSLRLAPAANLMDGGGNLCVPGSTSVLTCTAPLPPIGGYYTVTASPAAPVVVVPGSAITVMYGVNIATDGDYIGFALAGADDQHLLSVQYTGGASVNAAIFMAPATPGRYEFRYMKVGVGRVVVSNPVTVGSGS